MKTWLGLGVLAIVGFLVVVPITRFLLTRNQVERELEASLIEYQTLPADKFQRRIEKVVSDNELPETGRNLSIEHPTSSSVLVTIRYEADFRVLFFPVHRTVVVTKGSSNLGM